MSTEVLVVSSFDVNWPARVNGLLDSMQVFSPTLGGYLGIGCLANQQTVELVMVWRWLMPAMLGAACLVASPASLLIRWLLRKATCRVIQKPWKLVDLWHQLGFRVVL